MFCTDTGRVVGSTQRTQINRTKPKTTPTKQTTMTYRKTRSQNKEFRSMIPETAEEDHSLVNAPVSLALSNVRAFGGAIQYEYGTLWLRILHARVNSTRRGRLYGQVKDMRFNGSGGKEMFYVTGEIVAYSGNIVRTDDGVVYSIESASPIDSTETSFELVHLQNTLNLPAF